MNDGMQHIVMVFGVMIGILLTLLLFAAFEESSRPYMKGQIDCLMGNVNVELVQQPDGTTQWERIERSAISTQRRQ